MRQKILTCLLLLPGVSFSAAQTVSPAEAPAFSGYVTRVDSPSGIEVDGVPVVLGSGVVIVSPAGAGGPYVGQVVALWGKGARNSLAFEATKVTLLAPKARHVSGTGLIEKLDPSPAGTHRFRADGREFELADSMFGNGQPMTSTGITPARGEAAAYVKAGADDVQVNHWIDYSGEQREDGIVTVDYVEFSDNTVNGSETKLRKHEEWDASAVKEEAKQSSVNRFLLGTDIHRIPPYQDPQMQSRVDRIGHSLIPGFQRDLAQADPLKIPFQFQLVDEPKWGDCITSPGGVILVPYQLIELLRNDSQVAALLADNIATAIEKQTYRARNKQAVIAITHNAAESSILLSPISGVAGMLAAGGAHKFIMNGLEQQSGRVALGLMHDAGYDIRQAPEAWWILINRKDADPHRNAPPARAKNQLESLGTTWQGERQLPSPQRP